MSTRKPSLRILKFLGKVIAGLLVLLLAFILILHIPSVQNRIAHRLLNTLSTAMKARIELQHIRFSLLGNVEMEGLQVWDPDSNLVFTVGAMGIKSNIFDIISGDYLFDELRIEDLKGQLTQNKDGLNIDFILDAFAPKDKLNSIPDSITKDFKFHFKRIILQNIALDFISEVSGTKLSASLGNASSENAEYSTRDNMISADEFCFGQLDVHILSHDQPDTLNAPVTSTVENIFIPDFGIGLGLDIKDFEITNSNFAFHRNAVITTTKFDPNHIDLRDIQISLLDFLMRTDTMSASLQTISSQLSGFSTIQASGGVKMNRSQLALTSFHISSDTNDLLADLTAVYNPLSTRPDVPDVTFMAQAKINPADLSYFLNETLTKNFNHWKTTSFSIDGNYIDGKGNLKKLNINTSNSQLTATGMLEDVLSAENISWSNLAINASVGPDFKTLLTPYLGDIKIPPSIKVQMNSTGNPNRIFIDGKVLTTWGDVNAKGTAMPMGNTIGIDMNLSGQHVSLGEMLDMPWLGPVSMTADAKGKLGRYQNAQINGTISSIVIMDQSLYDIAFQSRVTKDSLNSNLSINDPRYKSKIHSQIAFAEPMVINTDAQLTGFRAGTFFQLDSSLTLSGDLISSITIDQSSLKGNAIGKGFSIHNQYGDYAIDTLSLIALTSPDSSSVNYIMDDGKGTLSANFDLRELPGILKTWSTNIEHFPHSNIHSGLNRTMQFNMAVANADPFRLLGFAIDDFSSLKMSGEWNEQQQSFILNANSGLFKGYGLSLDTLYTNISIQRDSANAVLNANNLFFKNYELGNLDFDISTTGDTAVSNLLLSHDSISLLGWKTRVLRNENGLYLFPDKLLALEHEYTVEGNHPILIKAGNVSFDHFKITRENMEVSLNGDVHAFDASFNNMDLTLLNIFLFPDSAVINKGLLTGTFTFATNQQLNLKATIDSLELYHSVPLTISMTAVKNGDEVPFEFLLSNATNKVDAHGKYFFNNENVDASLLLNVNNPEMFAFLYSDYLDNLKGTIKGHATINGPIKNPELNGSIRFMDMNLTSTDPKLTFNIKDDSIKLNNNGLTLDHFKIYDREMHPLTLSGNLNTSALPKYKYDLKIKADDYALIDNADSIKGPLKGMLVIDSDIALSGNEKDTYVKADITVKDKTNLKYTLATEDDAVLNTMGIVEFVDPGQLTDTLHQATSETAYDSIIAGLSDFNLNAKIKIQDNAKIKVITDAQSGDYFEAAGGANLELSQDRTGNPQLAGTYTIKKGIYRISFYDLVKKTFELVPGSSINWSGSPESGEMDIKAVYPVATNSIGLVGHEIGDNEKNIYKRTLEYTVGINIKGTLEQPIISFSLDLPEEDKASYPLLANKLDRLKLPEFQTELNKQVFGLLVLGGFLPETSVAEIDQSQVATTAIYNSVNALLASQLNRFASQYIKGVNIDVGIQSYADYSTPGGKTQTAMDFRVSKSVFNDRLSFEVGGDFDLNAEQSGGNTGDNYRGDVAIIYDLTGNGDKQLKLFNNESYDIIYQEIRNTGISLIFVREFNKGDLPIEKAAKAKAKAEAQEKGGKAAGQKGREDKRKKE